MSPYTSRSFPALPSSLRAERQGAIALLHLMRPKKRNALDDAMVIGIEAFFAGSLIAASAAGDPQAQQRLQDFLQKRAPKALHGRRRSP